jgi:cyclophilin family peptidyl-prolyl cis-trans isomerase
MRSGCTAVFVIGQVHMMNRRMLWSALAGSTLLVVATVGCGQSEEPSGRWVTAAAVSPDGFAYELALAAQPVPSARDSEDGFTRFSMGPADLTVRNVTPDKVSTALSIDVYLFHDCGILGAESTAASPTGDTVIAMDSWTAGDDRFVAPDGGYCVQRLAPAKVAGPLDPGESATVTVGLEDVGFVAPAAEAGRIETMLGTPSIIQFGLRQATASDPSAVFYSPRISVGRLAGDVVTQRPQPVATVSEIDVPVESAPVPTTLVATDGSAPAAAESIACPGTSSHAERRRDFDAAPPTCIDVTAAYQAVVKTNVGEFTIVLDSAAAPAAVNNFAFLTRYGYFDETRCHRAIKDFVVQCGDPTGTGFGGPGYAFRDELPTTQYQIGDIAMANSGPDTNGSQFFIVTGPEGTTLPLNYTRFGHVTVGLEDTIVWMNALGADGSASQSPSQDITIESVTLTTI